MLICCGKFYFRSVILSNEYSQDHEVIRLIRRETEKQQNTINLIAAENYASPAVLLAQGSVFTNKYAEGYPGHRYYSGCVNADEVESLAIERAKKLFKADHANVQPHSGSQANMAAYFAVLQPGDKVMGMMLNHGGHLTHGAKANFSGKWYDFVSYGLNRETERIDYDEVEKLANQNRPKLIIAGASSYPRIIDFQRFSDIARSVNAFFMADIAHIAGFVVTSLHPSPLPMADIVTTSTHKTMRGPRSGIVLCNKQLAGKIDAAVFPCMQGGPQVHAVAAKAVAFYEAMQPQFTDYQKATLENARALAAELGRKGFRIVTGGTENHIVLVDLTSTGITGITAQEALESAGILANKNAIPFDSQPPQHAGGIRFGTPAITTRGFSVKETLQVAAMIGRVLSNPGDKALQKLIREETLALCSKFPAPGLNQ